MDGVRGVCRDMWRGRAEGVYGGACGDVLRGRAEGRAEGQAEAMHTSEIGHAGRVDGATDDAADAAVGEAADGAADAAPKVTRPVREYLVKLRGFSYARSVWMRGGEIEGDGKLSKNALGRFLRRLADDPASAIDAATYEEAMDAQRVIGHRRKEGRVEFLIKWAGLPYAECSW